MITLYNQLPRVYYKESRDFQLLARIFESIANYNKMSVDAIENFRDTNYIDEKLVNLLAKTIGFESKHEYDVHNLKIICGCFSEIIVNKGTKIGIDKAISALLNSQGITDSFSANMDYDIRHLDVLVPSQTKDIILLKDLFDYILPIGWSYSIETAIGGDDYTYSANPRTSMSFKADPTDTSDLNDVAKLNGGETGQESKPASIHIVANDPSETGE